MSAGHFRSALLVAVAGAVALAAWAVACGDGGEGAPGGDSEGARLYANSCASCHGDRGQGAPNWRERDQTGAFPPPPHDVSGHTWHHADGLLFRIIRDGCAAYGSRAGACNMPAFGGTLTDAEIREVLEYIRGWWGPDERAFQADVSRADPLP